MDRWLAQVHPEWRPLIGVSVEAMDPGYCRDLQDSDAWLPGNGDVFAAFSLPLSQTRYVLLGESPYPRKESANGFAFHDASVSELWSPTGFSKQVNRATSLRNFLKMLLFARKDLQTDFSQPAIAALGKSSFWQTGEALFGALGRKGFLLLNASLAFSPQQVRFHARHWQPFFQSLLHGIARERPAAELVLFGRIAEAIPADIPLKRLVAPHPYNLGFITHPDVVNFFEPLDLLKRHDNHSQSA